jgi:tRNA dimethylallyltransferase
MVRNKIVFIVGPTASGKSAISLELARKLNAEIVSCDSMQVYRSMNIGTDKVSPASRAQVPHHMIDICDPSDEYSAFDYRRDALTIISKIHARNRLAFVVGGSGLYIKALCDGLAPYPSSSHEIRSGLRERAQTEGLAALYDELAIKDPTRARQIHANDERRIIRALEICYQSAVIPSANASQKESLADLGHDFGMVGLAWSREELYERVNRRVDEMIAAGLVDEVRRLKPLLSQTTSHAVGYKEIVAYLDGKCTLAEAIDDVKKNTRHLVKKQLTWFRKEDRIRWIKLHNSLSFDERVRSVEKEVLTMVAE